MRSLSFPLRATSRPSSTNRFLTRSIFLILILRTREISSLVEQLIFHSLLSQLSKIRALRICWELCFPFELSSWRDLRSSSVTLTEDERKSLQELSSKGKHNYQQILNALILLNCDKSEWNINCSTNEEISRVLNISMRKIDRVKKRFVEEGLEVALNGKGSDRIYSKKVDGDAEAHLVALSCSQPPEGFARWSLRLLADKAVELGYFENISHETVRCTLKKTKSNPGKRKDG